ncbi:hypothetical protein [Nocardioides sp. KR10-350]|uniref:hypothetical protein n=1 Tax=Nocardioides cheoyonin TaxID=3156615 RepID=UPI0032B52F31
MEPADVTAVPADVVAEVLRDPAGFLDAAAQASPGWAIRYGGPKGVAQLTTVLHDELARLTKLNAELRTATLVYLRNPAGANLTLAKLADLLGVSSMAVSLASRRKGQATDPGPFSRLESPDGWAT